MPTCARTSAFVLASTVAVLVALYILPPPMICTPLVVRVYGAVDQAYYSLARSRPLPDSRCVLAIDVGIADCARLDAGIPEEIGEHLPDPHLLRTQCRRRTVGARQPFRG